MTPSTTRLYKSPLVPIRTLRVEVLSGPNQGERAETSEQETLTIGTAPGNDLRLTDDTVSRFHLELSREDAGIRVSDLGSSNGTSCNDIQIQRAVVSPGSELTLGRSRVRVDDGAVGAAEMLAESELDDLRGQAPVMRRLMAQIITAARSSAPVLLIGESGTGKELVARALHTNSERSAGPFVTLDCSAQVETLVGSELFGHERGAFTGADRQRKGAFEQAHTGTLFLDEIGELPPGLQPQLLGAIERKRLKRVGGTTEIPVDVRLIAATNRDLRSEVNSGAFRLDLYFRLAVVLLRVPPLREHLTDLPLLVAHFLQEAGHVGPTESVVSDEQMRRLSAHSWPGNVRELRNWVEATLAMGESPELAPDSMSGRAASRAAFSEDLMNLPYKEARRQLLDDFEQRYLGNLIHVSDGNVARAARHAAMDRTYLIKLMQRHKLK
jgi:DNA-binding NtrC family response regulator